VTLKIRYRDFWPGFSPEDFIFTQILKQLTLSEVQIVVSKKVPVDIEICSVFSFKSAKEKAVNRLKSELYKGNLPEYVARSTYGYRLNYSSNAKKRIWYTGENKRPPVSTSIDGTLSFDGDDSKLNNIYFPYWMTRIDWNSNAPTSMDYPKPDTLTQSRAPSLTNGEICSFASNIDPERERILSALSGFKSISRFGKSVGRPVTSKIETARKFTFQVCNENDLYPGYVTEKLQEAWLSGNIPVWTGIHRTNHFNENAYLNVTGLATEEIQETIASLTPAQIKFMQSEPLLNHVPALDSLKVFFNRIL
jgi:hypothetical protein